MTHEVLAVEGLAGGRPDVAADDEAVLLVLHRHEQEEVREAEVGQQVPRRDEPLQVRGLRPGEISACPERSPEAWPRRGS